MQNFGWSRYLDYHHNLQKFFTLNVLTTDNGPQSWIGTRQQGSFPAGTPGNGVPKVILTVGTALKPALGELYKKHPVCIKICLFEIQNQNFFWGGAHNLAPHLLILEPPLFGSHTSFSRKRALLEREHQELESIRHSAYLCQGEDCH